MDGFAFVHAEQREGFIVVPVRVPTRDEQCTWSNSNSVITNFCDPFEAARLAVDRFGAELVGATETATGKPAANFAIANAQGSLGYSTTMAGPHSDLDEDGLAIDAVKAVRIFATASRFETQS
jgi:hypothetical protein